MTSTTIAVSLNKRRVKLAGGRVTEYWTLRWNAPSGKRCSKALKNCRTKAEAESQRRQKQTDLAEGRELIEGTSGMTLAQLVQWHLDLIEVDREKGTVNEYRLAGKHLMAALGSGKRIETVRLCDAATLKRYMRDERHTKASTTHKTVSAAKAIFRRAVQHQLLARNPFTGVELPQIEPKQARIFSPDEIRQLADRADAEWMELYIRLAFASGLRMGEMVNLQWQDVIDDEVHVRSREPGTFDHDGTTYLTIRFKLKTTKSRRSVPIPADVVALVRRAQLKSDSPYLFLTLRRLKKIEESLQDGAFTASKNLKPGILDYLHRLQKAVGLKGPLGTVHDIRKSYGTVMAGVVPMPTLQRYMGHTKVTTTAAYYCHERECDADAAREAMANLGRRTA